jgi:uncharacterized membrane protein YhaH (DUF805 family)
MSRDNPFQSSSLDDYAPSAPTLSNLLFSFDGRIGRGTYWLAYFGLNATMIAAMVAVVFVAELLSLPDELLLVAGLLGLIPITWIGLALQVKRWHDRNKSGWWCLIAMVPYVGGLWQLVECGFLPGTPGRNDYGEDPAGLR